MDILTENLITLSRKPEYRSEEFKRWIGQGDFLRFLQTLGNLEEIVLYASLPYTFIYGVLVPTKLVTPPNLDDLDRWSCNPFSSWGITISYGKRPNLWLSPPLDHTSSETLDRGEQIVFAREFDGRQEERSYIEISQKVTHAFELHYVPERGAFCRFDERGDIEDVVRVKNIAERSGQEKGQVVTIRRSTLNEYLTMTRQTLVLLFDSTRFEPNKFVGWQNQEVSRQVADSEIYWRNSNNSEEASYARGFQLIRSAFTKKDVIARHGFGSQRVRQYASFIANDWKHGKVHECSCDPAQLGNYFVESDFPFETSPAFFRPEVLLKYKSDTDKYQIGPRSITCKHAWHLQTYDLNEAGQVHTYLIYLSYLPYEEQLYWKSFNEPPKGTISRRAFQTDFEGKWDHEYDPLRSLTRFLSDIDDTKVSWWTLRDKALLDAVHYPVAKSGDEWAKELHTLHKLLIEGFVTTELRARLKKLDCKIDPQWKSLKLIDEFLRSNLLNNDQIEDVIKPLQELNFLRSKISGHASGQEAKQIKTDILKQHKTYSQHFRHLSMQCDKAVRKLGNLFGLNKKVDATTNT